MTCCSVVTSSQIVTGGMDCKVQIYDISTGQKMQSLMGHKGRILALQFDSTSKIGGGVQIWQGSSTGSTNKNQSNNTAPEEKESGGVIPSYLLSGGVYFPIFF